MRSTKHTKDTKEEADGKIAWLTGPMKRGRFGPLPFVVTPFPFSAIGRENAESKDHIQYEDGSVRDDRNEKSLATPDAGLSFGTERNCQGPCPSVEPTNSP
ncbi:MAG: hypothetical protein ABMA01_23720 [Chthoniobacteraceae bacterium]